MRPSPVPHQPAVCGIADTNDPNWYPGSGGISYWYVMYNYLRRRARASATRYPDRAQGRQVHPGRRGRPGRGRRGAGHRRRQDPQHPHPARACVLGSGGWKSNVAMRVNWDPRLDEDFGAGGLPYVETTGEMIMAANDIGADLTGMDFVCEFRVKWGTKIYQLLDERHQPRRPARRPDRRTIDNGICVDVDGKRFIDEYTSNPHRRARTSARRSPACRSRAPCWFVCSDDKVAANSNWRTALADAAAGRLAVRQRRHDLLRRHRRRSRRQDGRQRRQPRRGRRQVQRLTSTRRRMDTPTSVGPPLT